MQALIPNKDILFTLTSFQKNFLEQTDAFPVFPLWAFTELPLMEMNFVSCRINAPETDCNEYYFPVEIKYKFDSEDDGSTIRTSVLKIVFASQNPDGKKISAATENVFPVKQRVFRTADVLHDSSSWKINCERWVKVVSTSSTTPNVF